MQPTSDTDDYDPKLGSLVDAKTIKELSILSPWRGIVQIVLEWTGIVLAIVLCETYWNPLLYLIAVAWIGARQNGLAVLMHEATHYRLLPNRRWNEWVGEIFTAIPLLITVNGYRQTHFPHHRHVNGQQDPDWQRCQQNPKKYYPQSMREMVITTVKYWLGYYMIEEFLEFQQESKLPTKLQYLRIVFFSLLIAASTLFHIWLGLLLYWVVPLSTYFLWVIFIRSIAEHTRANYKDLLQKTRHVDANLLERLLIAPNRINVHLAHHLYPSVPFYNLAKLQRLLMQNPEFVQRAHISKSYLALMKESFVANKQSVENMPST